MRLPEFPTNYVERFVRPTLLRRNKTKITTINAAEPYPNIGTHTVSICGCLVSDWVFDFLDSARCSILSILEISALSEFFVIAVGRSSENFSFIVLVHF